MQRYTDFETVTREALKYALQALGQRTPGLEDMLMKAYSDLTPFDDTATTLNKLDEAGFGAAILSNGSPTMLNSTIEAAGLQDAFEYVLSVEQAGVFKPHPATYRLAVEAFDLEARRMLFVSANAWDVAGASTFGYQTAWVNRAGALPENVPGSADVEVKSLSELAELLINPPAV